MEDKMKENTEKLGLKQPSNACAMKAKHCWN